MDPRLTRRLQELDQRARSLGAAWAVAAWWALIASAGAFCWLRELELPLSGPWFVVALVTLGFLGSAGIKLLALRVSRDARADLYRIENQHPELRSALLAAVDQGKARRAGYLQHRLVQEVLEHSRQNDWLETIPTRQLRWARGMQGLAAGLLVFACLGLWGMTPKADRATSFTPTPDARLPVLAEGEVVVEPGDVELERGRSLVISARFSEKSLPSEAQLRLRREGSEDELLSMSRSLQDPLFGRRLAAVETDLSYCVEWPTGRSEFYAVTTFVFPELERSDVELVYPAYARMEPRTIEDTRRATAPEGTTLRLDCLLNKEGVEARLVEARVEDGEVWPLVADPAAPRHYRCEQVLRRDLRLQLELVDADGRQNRSRVEFVFRVRANEGPQIQLTSLQDRRVSPLEELTVQAGMRDDYGLERVGLSYRLGGGEVVDVVLAEGEGLSREAEAIGHTIAFEELAARPDQLLSYHFWAEDRDTEEEPRRVASDLYFAEVRPFEEIFRQGEAPPEGAEGQPGEREPGEPGEQPGGEQNPGAQAGQMGETQKSIVLATWRLIREEADGAAAEQIAEDAQVVLEAQQELLEQSAQLGESSMLPLPELEQVLEKVGSEMQQAVDDLQRVVDGESPALHDALSHEQEAYQALLSLRAREFEVARQQSRQQNQQQQQQQQQQQRQTNQPTQQQLNQLELSNSQNRYETRSQARERQELSEEQSREQTEARENLQRLQDLARRQADVNDRVRELQAELEAAESEEEKEELQRRLERLQEEQEEILRDSDELLQEMEDSAPSNPSDEQLSMEQARDNVRRAAEALEEGELSEALSEGGRAQEELEDLEEDAREQLGEQFDERMRSMREEAERLAEEQQRLAEALNGGARSPSSSLREEDAPEDLGAEFERQREDVERLMEDMEDVVQDAEVDEPLLAQELYDTLREARSEGLSESLAETESLVDRGFVDDARDAEQQAREDLDQLREGVQRAADQVLGSDAEALERASEELDRLTEELEAEIDRARARRDRERGETPEGQPEQGQPGEPREGEPGQGQPGEPREGQPGQGQPGEQREGQPGQGQQGEPQEGQPGQGQPGEQREGQPGQGQPGEPQEGQPGQGQPGQGQPGQGQPGQGQPGDPREGQPGQGQPGEPREGQPGQGQPGEPQEGQPGQGQPGEPREGQPGQGQPGEPREGQPGGRQGSNPGGRNDGGRWAGSDGEIEDVAPLSGEDYLDWSRRLRDVEEMLDDPQMGADAARVRSRARTMRQEARRHSKDPNWDLVEEDVLEPLAELRRKVDEELRRRRGDDPSVPLDRDPVPPRFEDDVRRYYERLGKDER